MGEVAEEERIGEVRSRGMEEGRRRGMEGREKEGRGEKREWGR